MNKLACLLLFPFVATQPLAPAATRSLSQVVLPAAPPAGWTLPGGLGLVTTRPSAIRALGRLLRAYTEPARPGLVAGTFSGAPFSPSSLHHA